MSALQEHQSVNLADEERCGSSRRLWEEDRQQQHPHQPDLAAQQHPSSSMNTFLVEMTNCDEDYFNTQEVPTIYLYFVSIPPTRHVS